MIRAQGLELGYRRRPVFVSASFEIPGGAIGLLGPNGAGKSTLMLAVAGLKAPAAGSLEVLGISATSGEGRAELSRLCGYLAQDAPYDPSFTVREHVEYCGWLKGLAGQDLRRCASDALDGVSLGGEQNTRMGRLSGGMRRRATIAGALVSRPQLLILDEPTAGLDPEQRAMFRSLVVSLAQSASVLLSTHLVEDVVATCTDVAVLAHGDMKFVGSLDALAATSDSGGEQGQRLESGYLSFVGNGDLR